MLGWALSHTLLSISLRLLGDQPRTFVVFVRSLSGMIFLLPAIYKQGLKLPSKTTLAWHLLRSCFCYASMSFGYLGYNKLPLSTASAIGFTEPVMEMILASFIFGLAISPKQWAFMALGYAGVLIMHYPFAYSLLSGMLLALAANLFASLTRMVSKHLTQSTSIHEILFYGFLISTLMGFFLAKPHLHLLVPTSLLHFFSLVPPSAASLSIAAYSKLLALSLFSFSSVYCYIKALDTAHFDLIGPLSYTRLIVAVPLAYLFFGEYPTVLTLLGNIMILVSNYFLLFGTAKKINSKSH